MPKGWCQPASSQIGKMPPMTPDHGRKSLRELRVWADLPAEDVQRESTAFLASEGGVSSPTFYFKPVSTFTGPLSLTLYLFGWRIKWTGIFPQPTLVPSILGLSTPWFSHLLFVLRICHSNRLALAEFQDLQKSIQTREKKSGPSEGS